MPVYFLPVAIKGGLGPSRAASLSFLYGGTRRCGDYPLRPANLSNWLLHAIRCLSHIGRRWPVLTNPRRRYLGGASGSAAGSCTASASALAAKDPDTAARTVLAREDVSIGAWWCSKWKGLFTTSVIC